jgi:hypothetical protein
MKTEVGIRRKSGYALGFALAAGIAVTTTLIAHAQQADAATECPVGEVCGPVCEPSTTCDPVEITGFFVRQKPDLACVYQCTSEQTCTNQHADCSTSTSTTTLSFRRREVHPAGACPMDDASAASICMNGQVE